MNSLSSFFGAIGGGGVRALQARQVIYWHHVCGCRSPLEVAKFEGGICLFGKRFHKLQQLIKTKTCKEIVEFYYKFVFAFSCGELLRCMCCGCLSSNGASNERVRVVVVCSWKSTPNYKAWKKSYVPVKMQ